MEQLDTPQTPIVVQGEVHLIPLTKIRRNESIRRELNPGNINKLRESIRAGGYMFDIPVSCRVEGSDEVVLISGGHRLKAAEILGIKEIQCHVLPPTDESLRCLYQIAGNHLRVKLDPFEMARALQKLVAQGYPILKICEHLGHDKSYVTHYLNLNTKICDYIKNKPLTLVNDDGDEFHITERHLRPLTKIPKEEQPAVFDAMCKQLWSSGRVEAEIKKQFPELYEKYFASGERNTRGGSKSNDPIANLHTAISRLAVVEAHAGLALDADVRKEILSLLDDLASHISRIRVKCTEKKPRREVKRTPAQYISQSLAAPIKGT